MAVWRPEPPRKQGRALGVLEVVVGVLFGLLGLMIMGAMMIYPSSSELTGQIGMFSFFSLVIGFILVWHGRRRLNKAKHFQNNQNNIVL